MREIKTRKKIKVTPFEMYFYVIPQVGQAFMTLLSEAPTGSVAATWKDAPLYYVPDVGQPLFVACTTAAMAMRFVPGFGGWGPGVWDKSIGKGTVAVVAAMVLASWWVAGKALMAMVF